jgi:hypothetical protein
MQKRGKTLVFTVLRLLYNFLSLQNDENVPSKMKKHKRLEEKNHFCWRR